MGDKMNVQKVDYLCSPVNEWHDSIRPEKRVMIYARDCEELLRRFVNNSDCEHCVCLARIALENGGVRVVIENFDNEYKKHISAIV
jgi:hypothetical protein